MSYRKSKTPTDLSTTISRPGGSGTPVRQGPDLDRSLRQFAAHLKRDFATEIEENPAIFKRRAVHGLKINLPPGPGRPTDENVTRAVEMRYQGKNWQEVYAECIPNCASLDTAFKQVYQWKLRAAVRSRRNAARRRAQPSG